VGGKTRFRVGKGSCGMTHAPGSPGARRLPLPQKSFSGDVNRALGLGRISWGESVFWVLGADP
jgi:hypothetical protein